MATFNNHKYKLALASTICLFMLYFALPTSDIFKSLPTKVSANESIRVLLWTTRYNGGSDWLQGNISCSRNKRCEFTTDRSLLDESQALVFNGWYADTFTVENTTNNITTHIPSDIPGTRNENQYWTFFNLEPPAYQDQFFAAFDNFFNWTMSYRTDSDIYIPFGGFVKLEPEKTEELNLTTLLKTKQKLAIQVASMCKNPSRREELVKALQKHIPVDIYGKCGPLKCPSETANFDCKAKVGKEYKFYLAFENSLCDDYVTEKFFEAYAAGMVPVVYGGANYDQIAPQGSFINVNSFPSAKALADYLNYLDRNDEEYLKFFKWRKSYKVTFMGMNDYEHLYCRLCEKLHEDYPRRIKATYPKIADWISTVQGRYPACNEPIEW